MPVVNKQGLTCRHMSGRCINGLRVDKRPPGRKPPDSAVSKQPGMMQQ